MAVALTVTVAEYFSQEKQSLASVWLAFGLDAG